MKRFLIITTILLFVFVALTSAQSEYPGPADPTPTVDIWQDQPPFPPLDQQVKEKEYEYYFPLAGGGELEGPGFAWAGKRESGDDVVLGVSWFLVWGIQKPGYNPGGHFEDMIYVPYFSCDTAPPHAYGQNVTWRSFDRLYLHYPSTYSGYLLWLNEPDLEGDDIQGQCERTPRQAYFMYKQLLQEYPYAKIIGPAVSHADYYNNWEWLRAWYDLIEAGGLSYPYMTAIHTYVSHEPASRIVNSHFSVLAEYEGAPTEGWVTEFGNCQPQVVANMVDTFQTDARILAWAYFAPRLHHLEPWACLSLFTDNKSHSLSPVGQAFLDAHANPTNLPEWGTFGRLDTR